jgi:uncharacterized protein YqgC (DUF456 family)
LLLGAAKLQASRWAYLGAGIGLLVGLLGLLPALPLGGPLVGALLGPLLGASAGEFIAQLRVAGAGSPAWRLVRALKVGVAVMLGMLVSRLAQVCLSLIGVVGFVLLTTHAAFNMPG